MPKRCTSRIEAGASPTFPKRYVRIEAPRVEVTHEDGGPLAVGQAVVWKTLLLQPGTVNIRYMLDQGQHDVQPGEYDHAALYAGASGYRLFSSLVYAGSGCAPISLAGIESFSGFAEATMPDDRTFRPALTIINAGTRSQSLIADVPVPNTGCRAAGYIKGRAPRSILVSGDTYPLQLILARTEDNIVIPVVTTIRFVVPRLTVPNPPYSRITAFVVLDGNHVGTGSIEIPGGEGWDEERAEQVFASLERFLSPELE